MKHTLQMPGPRNTGGDRPRLGQPWQLAQSWPQGVRCSDVEGEPPYVQPSIGRLRFATCTNSLAGTGACMSPNVVSTNSKSINTTRRPVAPPFLPSPSPSLPPPLDVDLEVELDSFLHPLLQRKHMLLVMRSFFRWLSCWFLRLGFSSARVVWGVLESC